MSTSSEARARGVPTRSSGQGHVHLPVYLSLTDAASVVAVSVKTIRRRVADGTIPAYTCGRGTLRIRLDELEEAMHRVPASQRRLS